MAISALSCGGSAKNAAQRSEEHTSELQSPCNIVCRLLLEKKACNGVSECMVSFTAPDFAPSTGAGMSALFSAFAFDDIDALSTLTEFNQPSRILTAVARDAGDPCEAWRGMSGCTTHGDAGGDHGCAVQPDFLQNLTIAEEQHWSVAVIHIDAVSVELIFFKEVPGPPHSAFFPATAPYS